MLRLVVTPEGAGYLAERAKTIASERQ
jgi:hypothetical protein